MIDETTAGQQIGRMMGLDFFPTKKPAMRELVTALTSAATEQIAASFVSGWLADCTEAPKPAEIRRLVGDRNEQYRATLAKCDACGGLGIVPRWYLVTYRGNGFNIERSELLDIANEEQAQEFGEKIAAANLNKRQAVLSAARPCACRKAA